ncbi:hypothetical protein QWZ10_10930 [Paracoccus cavernae]|uniref:SOS response-associated peptidase n=1 Tax=Paracoccus cavernae TaxID=1571207 RepID=A0ABT8D5Y8_9RHOB|nr:hypothetical protein [Paracoccus cavernae]
MCNLYQTPKSADLIAQLFREPLRDLTGNEPWPEEVDSDRNAPIIRHDGDGLVVARARWGVPTKYLNTSRLSYVEGVVLNICRLTGCTNFRPIVAYLRRRKGGARVGPIGSSSCSRLLVNAARLIEPHGEMKTLH